MHTVDSCLRAADQQLNLAVRRKVVLLRELRSDLEGMETTLQEQGLSVDDARAHALRLLAPTDDALADLVALHSPWYPRITRAIPPRVARVLEGIGVSGMALLALLSPLVAYTRITGLPAWTVGALGSLTMLVTAHLMWCAFRGFLREDTDATSLVHAGATQAGLFLLTLGIGATAVAVEVFFSFGQGLDGDVVEVARAVATCAETAALALGIGMLSLFGTCALFGAHLLAWDVEEEYRQLLDHAASLAPGELP